jgi:hypothetical protein
MARLGHGCDGSAHQGLTNFEERLALSLDKKHYLGRYIPSHHIAQVLAFVAMQVAPFPCTCIYTPLSYSGRTAAAYRCAQWRWGQFQSSQVDEALISAAWWNEIG